MGGSLPSKDQIVSGVLALVDRYSELTGLNISQIGRRCTQDARFFTGLKEGKGMTLDRYEAVTSWLRAEIAFAEGAEAASSAEDGEKA